MDRRDFLVLWLQALLLSLFPWLRTASGLKLAEQAAEASVERVFGSGRWRVATSLVGWELTPKQAALYKQIVSDEHAYLYQLPSI